MRKLRQMQFRFPIGHGGARKGAGRKSQGPRPCVPHTKREIFTRLRVLHITCRLAAGLPALRKAKTVALLMNLLRRHSEKPGFRIVEFSIQGNHLHLLCEAESQEALSKAMNGLLSALARSLNRHWSRRGKVFPDRYHAQPVLTPTQCRNALLYVLANAKKHHSLRPDLDIDPFSTAPWFPFHSHPRNHPHSQPHGHAATHAQFHPQIYPRAHRQGHPGRATTPHPLARLPKPAATPQSWLLREGWHRATPFTPQDHPRTPKRSRSGHPT